MTDDTLSFDDAQPAGPTTCSRCETTLTEYWAVDGAVLCERCKEDLLAERTSTDGRGRRVLKALGLGLGGMIVGAGVWYGVAKLTGYEIGFIAILLGFLVGKGVFLGSEKRGGLGYQLLAMAITWFGIGAAMAPFAYQELATQARQEADSLRAADSLKGAGPLPVTALSDSAIDAELVALDSAISTKQTSVTDGLPTGAVVGIGLAAVVLGILALPILSVIGGGSLIGIIIYGIALFEAWKFARRADPVVSGPHAIGPPAQG